MNEIEIGENLSLAIRVTALCLMFTVTTVVFFIAAWRRRD